MNPYRFQIHYKIHSGRSLPFAGFASSEDARTFLAFVRINEPALDFVVTNSNGEEVELWL